MIPHLLILKGLNMSSPALPQTLERGFLFSLRVLDPDSYRDEAVLTNNKIASQSFAMTLLLYSKPL